MILPGVAWLSLVSMVLLAGCGGSPATPVTAATPVTIPAAQVEQLAAALSATGKYGPSCTTTSGHLALVLPSLIGLGKGTLLAIDVLPLLTTAQKDLTADAAISEGLPTGLSAVADDLGRIRVALATLKPADTGPLTLHLKTLATDCGVD